MTRQADRQLDRRTHPKMLARRMNDNAVIAERTSTRSRFGFVEGVAVDRRTDRSRNAIAASVTANRPMLSSRPDEGSMSSIQKRPLKAKNRATNNRSRRLQLTMEGSRR